jgi:hypothetical protein
MLRAPHTAMLCAAALLAPGGASGDSITGLLEEDYSRVHQELSDALGAGQATDLWQLTQRYRLNLDKTLFPNLRLGAGGAFEQLLGSSRTGPLSTDLWGRTTNFYGLLTAGSQILSGTGGYTRRDVWPSQGAGLVNEEPSFSLSWRPVDAPSFFFRVSRPLIYDTQRRSQDLATLQGLLSAQYSPVQALDLRYTGTYSESQDRVHATDTTSISHTGGANYGRNFEPWNTAVAAGLNLTFRRTLVNSAGPGGTLTTPAFPLAGLSLVEAFPAAPSLDTLAPNPALIDGSITASAGLNLGFTPTLAGDVNPRDMGVQFADTLTQVNTFYVWVVNATGQPITLPEDVAATYQWSAWQSDDNLHWTQVDIAPAPQGALFAPFQSRFEITLRVPVAARYLKVVTRPLSTAATTDRNLADIIVTELQVLLVTPVTISTGWQSSNAQLLTLGGRTQLFGRPDVSYDLAMQFARSEQAQTPAAQTWLVANGLNFSRRLSDFALANARLARQDFDQGHGHEGAFLYSASVSADELPTLGHTASYSGQVNTAPAGTSTNNAISFYSRATPYRGIGLLAGFSWSTGTNVTGRTTRSNVVTINATIQPHPKLTLAGTFGRNGSVTLGGNQDTVLSVQQFLQGSVSFNPVPALYLSGSVQRTSTDSQTYTLTNVAAGFSPFPGGSLQFSVAFNETLDSNNAVTRLITPGVRWNITRAAVLSVSYALVDNTSPQSELHSRTFDVNLRIPF